MGLFSRRVPLDAAHIAALGPTPVIIISLNVGFQAHAVAIDNYSAYYIYLKDALSYIPPFWGGAVRVLYHTTDQAYAELSSPFGDPQLPTDTSYFVDFTWTDAQAAFTPGGSIAGITNNVLLNVLDDFRIEFLSTIVNLTGVPQALPNVSMPNRTSLMLQAPYSNSALVYVGGLTVTPDQTSSGGVQIYPGQSMPIEAGATAIVYGVQDPLQPVQQIIVMEGK